MAEMISVREAAVLWNITERRVATLCKDGRITGAKKRGNRWMIPADTQKPADQRLKTGAFRKRERAPKLPLPIGVSNYCLASLEYYYIDKTMMIKDFIDERPMVTLFTRPRRFGKTLNMDILRPEIPGLSGQVPRDLPNLQGCEVRHLGGDLCGCTGYFRKGDSAAQRVADQR